MAEKPGLQLSPNRLRFYCSALVSFDYINSLTTSGDFEEEGESLNFQGRFNILSGNRASG